MKTEDQLFLLANGWFMVAILAPNALGTVIALIVGMLLMVISEHAEGAGD